MKLIIDIPEEKYNKFMYSDDVDEEELVEAFEYLMNGTPISDNATNGDVVQMIFPYYSYERNDYVQSTEDYIVDSMECMEHDLYFAYDWWNAPYQKGGTNGND